MRREVWSAWFWPALPARPCCRLPRGAPMHDVISFGGVVLVWGLVGTAAMLGRHVAGWIRVPAPAIFLIAAAIAANSINAVRTAVDLHIVENVVTLGPHRHPFRRRPAPRAAAIPGGRGPDRLARGAWDLRHDRADRTRLARGLRTRLEILCGPRRRAGANGSRGRLRRARRQTAKGPDVGDPRRRVGIQRSGRHRTVARLRAARNPQTRVDRSGVRKLCDRDGGRVRP